jgi:hypothetical protein
MNSSSFKAFFVVAAASFAIVISISNSAYAQYTVGQAPSIDEITSETVFTVPANRARTDIGIGEQVVCRLDPTTWSDPDDGPSGDHPNDPIGTITWTVTGKGTIVMPATGNSVTMTAKKDGGSAVVKATIEDAAQFADDQPIERTKEFTVKVPTGIEVLTKNAVGFGALGSASSGHKADFKCQITPNNVNFKNAEFMIDYATQSFTYPSGYTANYSATSQTYSVTDVVTDVGTEPNIVYDWILGPRIDPALLIDATTHVSVTWSYELVGNNKYKKEDGTWSGTFEIEKWGHEFNGATLGARVWISASNTLSTTEDGPWSAAPTLP